MSEELKPPRTFIIGAAGAGKTSSIATYGLCGIETFVLFTEGGGEESLIDAIERTNAPMDKFHWCTVTAPPAGWQALKKMATTVRAMPYESLSSLKAGIEKISMTQLETFLSSIEDFPDDR